MHLSLARVIWSIVVVALAAVTAATAFAPLGDRQWEHPQLLFSVVSASAAMCVLAATVVIALADRRNMAEIGLLGTALMGASVMPLVHGLVTPDVLFDQTEAFRAAAFLSMPLAVVVGAPLLRPHSGFGRWAARNWRDWTLLSLLLVFIAASALVFFPDLVVVPAAGDPLTVVLSVAMAIALGAISIRQLRFYELGRHRANLIASLSLVALASTALLPMVETAYSPGFWWLRLTGVVGVLGACLGMAVSKRVTRTTQDLLAPVLARDPLVAFELGLSPVVHQFVADLDAKDQATRDHTIRTGEMALRVGERFRLAGPELRDLGLAAMLHDVGKVRLPDDIVKKTGRLTDDEYEIVKTHALEGAEMLAAEPALASAARIVRSHHERLDGSGYPDGLVGRDIPLAARIIAVCDAFDAMTHDRPYRPAMSVKMAHAVLREHAGTQWDPTVIDQVMSVLPSMSIVGSLDEVGRANDRVVLDDAAPADIGGLLAIVDAEI